MSDGISFWMSKALVDASITLALFAAFVAVYIFAAWRETKRKKP